MQMLYNSENFAVMQIEVAVDPAVSAEGADAAAPEGLSRAGYELVDKSARKGIFIEGTLATSFRQGVEALIQTSPSEEELDDYVARYSALMQQPVVMH